MDNPAEAVPAVQQLRTAQHSGSGNSSEKEKPENQNGSQRLQPISSFVSRYDKGWRRVVTNFSPSWFSVTMGTGIVSTILITIPWKAEWLYYLSIIFFVLNVCLFSAAFVISLLRYLVFPEIWAVMIDDPNNSLFLGTIPMGFATIVEMWIFVCVPAWGEWAAYFGWALWMLDSIVAVAVTVSLGILLMSASHQRSLDTITAAQLLPIAATIVAAGTGSEVAEVLPNPNYTLGTIIVCYVMWGMSVPMAFTVLVIYYQRLALHKIPPREVIVSAFLPLGPLGFGGYTILYLGRVSLHLFPKTDTIDPMAGRFAYIAGFFIALIMWGWGLLWFAFALASIHKSRPFPFNMGWWGFTFPLGVYSVSTMLIGEELPSLFFRVLGTIFGTAVILLWVLIAVRTAMGAWNGHLFNAPCMANLKREHKATNLDSGEEEKQELSTSQSGMGSSGSMHRRNAPDIDLASQKIEVES